MNDHVDKHGVSAGGGSTDTEISSTESPAPEPLEPSEPLGHADTHEAEREQSGQSVSGENASSSILFPGMGPVPSSDDIPKRLLAERLRRRLPLGAGQDVTVGRYRLSRVLGAGGMGIVFSAYDSELRRPVALKLIHEHLLDEPRYRHRMQREAQAMARLSHPNVVQVYEVNEHEEQLFIAMELVHGQTMRSWQDSDRRTWRAVVEKYIEAGQGLAAAHDVGLIHRDFKPDNILLGKDGRVRVTDFGVAQLDTREGPPRRTSTGPAVEEPGAFEVFTKEGTIVGTAAYMSPEQLSGSALDVRSDVFSFCVALYEGLYGARPFGGKSLPELASNIIEERVPEPPAGASVPPQFHRVLSRGLEADPERRYASIGAVLVALESELKTAIGGRFNDSGARLARARDMLGTAYVLHHLVHEDLEVSWVRATHRDTGEGVLIKVPHSPSPAEATRAALQREFELLRSFEHPGVLEARELVACESSMAMVLEHPGGVSVEALVGSRLCGDYVVVLRIALSIVETLKLLHGRHVVHGRVQPDALMVDLCSFQVVFMDLQAASSGRDDGRGSPVERRERAAAPLADHRADYYALGELLYELLTAQPLSRGTASPTGEGARSGAPLAPHLLEEGIPAMLSDLVLRLLAEDPRERYQSNRGLRADLQRCLDALVDGADIPAFELGTREVSPEVLSPEVLYGRDAEYSRMLEALERTRGGASELLLLAGPSGIGKTALVEELRASVARDSGRFIQGKFEQVGDDVPYRSLVQAFTTLFEQLASEPGDVQEYWRRRLRESLGDNLGVIAAMLPGFRRLVGDVTLVRVMPPNETANRFRESVGNLLKAIASPEHPLVVFLDDLQWSDASTLRLVKSAAMEDLGHLLWVGAFRDDEVDDEHLLTKMLDSLADEPFRITRLNLAPLSTEALGDMVSKMLSTTVDRVVPLVRLIHAKTDGNPFFARSLLESFIHQRLIGFDAGIEQWSWDLEAIAHAGVSDDVVELMTATLVRLPEGVLETVRVGACVGNGFDLDTVAAVLERPAPPVEHELGVAVTRGLLGRAPGGRYRFGHDRIQQAVYRGLSATDRARLHLAIGRHLRGRHEAREEWLFAIVGHLDAGLSLVDSAEERLEIATLGIRAGYRAKESNAFSESVRYFRRSLALVTEESWSGPSFKMFFEVQKALMEVEFLNQQPEESTKHFLPLLARARTSVQRAEVHEVRAVLALSMGHHLEAINVVSRGVACVGVRVPTRGGRLRVLLEYIKVKWILRGRTAKDLADLHESLDARSDVITRLLAIYSTSGYFVDPALLTIGMIIIMRLTLRHGLTDSSAFGFAGFAMVLVGAFDQYEGAAEYSRLALRLNERFGNATLEAKLEFIHGWFILLWVRPFTEARVHLERAIEAGIRNGDFAYSRFSVATSAAVHLLEGLPLDETARSTTNTPRAASRTRDHDIESILIAIRRTCMCFRGETFGPPSLSSSDWSEDEYAAGISDEETPLAMIYYRMLKLMTGYHFRSLEGVPKLLAEIHANIDAAWGNATQVEIYFYECLALVSLYPEGGWRQRRRWNRSMRVCLDRLELWSSNCASNYEARYLLAKAEYERVVRQKEDPLPIFTRAIYSARDAGAHHLEGLGFELAADYSKAQEHDLSVRAYASEACSAYTRWKAEAKVRFVERRFGLEP